MQQQSSGNAPSPLAWLIENYFVASSTDGDGSEWNDWQVPEADDDALIARCFAARGAASAFGQGVAFSDLWDNNVSALARAYPDPSGTRAYDSSSADMALSMHLAFWTRRDHARMWRLMWRSKLVRDKWQREDYLVRSIRKACAQQDTVLQPDKPPVSTPVQVDTTPTAAAPATQVTAQAYAGTSYLTPDDQVTYFAGCVYVVASNRVLTPGGFMLNQEQFNVVYGGKAFAIDNANGKMAKSAWDCFTHSQVYRFPRADAACFRPELGLGEFVTHSGQSLVNTYVPITTPAEPGDITPFIEHMRKLFPLEHDRLIVENYLAALVQFPGDKFQWWPVIQGTEGNGKSLILAVAEAAIGDRYCHRPNASDLAGNGSKFTGWLQYKLLVGIEEIKTDNRMALLDIMKPMITGDRLEMQAKGVDQVTGDNRANGLMFTNYKDAIPQKVDGRRYAIFYTPQQTKADIERDGMGGDYFPRLYAWLRSGGYARITHWLRTYPVRADLSPAIHHGGMAHRAPATSSTPEAIEMSIGRIEQRILDAIGSGEPGFCGGWVSSVMLGLFLDGIGGRNITPRKQRELMRSLGYDWHPGLEHGRVHNVVAPDGKKPVLYVRAGHLALNEQRPAEIARMYSAAQSGAFGVPQPFGAAGQQG